MASWFRARNLQIKTVVFESQDVMYEAFFSGRCDASDPGLLGARFGAGHARQAGRLHDLAGTHLQGAAGTRSSAVVTMSGTRSCAGRCSPCSKPRSAVSPRPMSTSSSSRRTRRCSACRAFTPPPPGNGKALQLEGELGLQHHQADRELRRKLRTQCRPEKKKKKHAYFAFSCWKRYKVCCIVCLTVSRKQ